MTTKKHKLTVDNFPPYAFAFYGVAIDEAARLAVRSFMEFCEAIEDGSSEAEAAGLLHDAVNHCAALSRFFWPSPRAGKVAEYRGQQLCKIYGVPDDSPLNNRDLRNHLEHLDEKIDQWLAFDPVGPILPGAIFDSYTICDEGFGHAFKIIDIENEVYVVMGNKFEFGPLSRAAVDICLKEGCI